MAVEARHVNSLHPQLVCDNNSRRQLLNGFDETVKMYGTSIESLFPPETFLPMYGITIADSLPTQAQTHRRLPNTLPLGRKRTRNSMYQLHPDLIHLNTNYNFTSFLGEDISLLMHHQQREIDHFLALHVEKMRSEIEQRREANWRRIEDVMVKKLRAKEDEAEKIVTLNTVLHEKARSLSIENQMWRDLAQTNEATVATLRTNIEQVMRLHRDVRGTDDAQSCCSSSNYKEEGEEEDARVDNAGKLCRKCGKEESCVLLLPCRHLCVCTVCGSGLNVCPVCKSTKTASLVVNKC